MHASADSQHTSRFAGVAGGILSVFLFSLTMPMMRLAEAAFTPVAVGTGRLVLAAPLAAVVLCFLGWPRLTWRQGLRVCFVAACLAFGFAWLLARALEVVPGYHAAIVIGGIPIFTALMAGWRGGRRQAPGFWLAALAGSAIVAIYGIAKSGWVLTPTDSMLLFAAASCGVGYGEAAKLGAEIGQAKLACLMPLAATPAALLVCRGHWPADWGAIPAQAWLGWLYNGWVSTFGAFFFWYGALHRGGAARIGQLQLLQPFFTLVVCALLLKESVRGGDWITAALVVGCVFAAQRAGRGKPA
jgi:drug/metabolite transporter (DMT)-like permease